MNLRNQLYYLLHTLSVLTLWPLSTYVFDQYPSRYFEFFPTLFWTFSLLMPLLHFVIYLNVETQKAFMQRFMLSMIIKFFSVLILVLIYRFSDGINKLSFISALFAIYLVYQSIEILGVLRRLRSLS